MLPVDDLRASELGCSPAGVALATGGVADQIRGAGIDRCMRRHAYAAVSWGTARASTDSMTAKPGSNLCSIMLLMLHICACALWHLRREMRRLAQGLAACLERRDLRIRAPRVRRRIARSMDVLERAMEHRCRKPHVVGKRPRTRGPLQIGRQRLVCVCVWDDRRNVPGIAGPADVSRRAGKAVDHAQSNKLQIGFSGALGAGSVAWQEPASAVPGPRGFDRAIGIVPGMCHAGHCDPAHRQA